MELYEALEKRRTCRDYSDREVSDEILKRVIGAAFKAPTNDHLRQLEFVVMRGRENIAPIIDPLAKNMAAFKKLVHEADEADESGDKDKMAMFADALPKQQRMLMQSGLLILPFFRQKQSPLLKPVEQSSLNYFASAWCALENMLLAATAEMTDHHPETPVITMSMGALGAVSRLCGEAFGSAMTFANPGTASAPGQVGLDVVNAVLDSLRLS